VTVPSAEQRTDSVDENIIAWLMEGDPAIRWQVMRDLAGAEPDVWSSERRMVAEEGWGAQLFSCQDADGRWGGGLYIPKWISTTYSMQLLRHLGLDPSNRQAGQAVQLLLGGGFRDDGSVTFGKTVNQADHGVTGITLALGAYFAPGDGRVHAMADYLIRRQKPDGSWDPEEGFQDFRYGIHASLLILDGLREYSVRYPARAEGALEAQARGREYLLRYRLFKQCDSGQVIDAKWTHFSFPPRWFYDVLAALDYFQACRAPRDPRLEDAIALVRSRRNKAGTWNLQNRHPGRTFFEMEEVGRPSRWNTLRALRVLKWWEEQGD
jgi:hypothetical protein